MIWSISVYYNEDSLIGSHSKECSDSSWLAEIKPSIYKCLNGCIECRSLTPDGEGYNFFAGNFTTIKVNSTNKTRTLSV